MASHVYLLGFTEQLNVMCITVSILWMKILRPEESDAIGPGLAVKVMAKHGLIPRHLTLQCVRIMPGFHQGAKKRWGS